MTFSMTAQNPRHLIALYIDALAHSVRRDLLKLVYQLDGGVLSPAEASKRMGEDLSNVSYHMKCLTAAGLLTLDHTQPVRGALAHFYRLDPDAVQHPLIQAFLNPEQPNKPSDEKEAG